MFALSVSDGGVGVGDRLQRYIVAFVNGLHPNAFESNLPLGNWPTWRVTDQVVMSVGAAGSKWVDDGVRNGSYEKLLKVWEEQVKLSGNGGGRGGIGGAGTGGSRAKSEAAPVGVVPWMSALGAVWLLVTATHWL